MNSVSIFEKSWLDLVFEGKNKSYGAYQLRRENQKTTLLAFGLALGLVLVAVAVQILVSRLSDKPIVAAIPDILPDIVVVDLDPPKPDAGKAIIPIEKKTEPENPDAPLKNPVVVEKELAQEISNEKPETKTETSGTEGVENTSTPTVGGSGTTPTPDATPSNAVEKTIHLDKQPAFPGGMGEFYEYVRDNFRTPEIEEGSQIRVFVTFVIEKDGSMTDIQTPPNADRKVAAEAVRVLKSLKTKWEPGMIKGNKVRTQYSLPITVKL